MHYGDEKKEKLQKLERKLYSRNTPDIIDAGRSELKDEKENSRETIGSESVNENGWQDIKKNNFDELAAKMSRVAQTKHSVIKKIFTLSLVQTNLWLLGENLTFPGFWSLTKVFCSRVKTSKRINPWLWLIAIQRPLGDQVN